MSTSPARQPGLAEHQADLDQYRSILRHYTGQQPHIQAAVLATMDGFEVATVEYQGKPRAAQLAAMASSLLALASAAGREVGHTGCDRLIVESAGGKLLVRPVGGDASRSTVLICLALTSEMLLGSALWTADEIAKAVLAL